MSQDEELVEVFTRNDDQSWTLRDVRTGTARIGAIECALDVAAIYASPFAGA